MVNISLEAQNQIRVAYWSGLSPNDTCGLHDSVFEALELDRSLTQEEEKVVFDMLPFSVVLEAVEYGFNDTEVGIKIFKFTQENKDIILKKFNI